MAYVSLLQVQRLAIDRIGIAADRSPDPASTPPSLGAPVPSKKDLNEQEIRSRFISPAVVRAGWDAESQIRENIYITRGRVVVRGQAASRVPGKFADYILFARPNLPIAIIEAKDNNHGVGDGMQQALGYAEMLDVPFVFSSNGDAFLFHDRTGSSKSVESELPLDRFPSPDELWRRYCAFRKITPKIEPVITQDYYPSDPDKAPRYYQVNAINKVVDAVARNQDRILLVMATGTGKTYTAFQIIWRLWKAGVKKRILFLADRNILVDQTRTNDFKPFGGAMTKITNRKVDKSFEVYLALYQAISGTEEARDIFRQFSPDFFDLIVVDECHRGSADENSAWREILEYFSSATQIGLTATPKETAEISTRYYFGDPVYTYSLRQGIDDGFLAPYKVIRVDIDKDLTGWRPEQGKLDKEGREIEDRIYNQSDFDRTLVLEQRTKLVARVISNFLKATDRYAKTIVFCEDIDHAERMRQELVNENEDLSAANRRYVVRITGDDPALKLELDDFIHPEERYPVIVTTSKLLSTGVDCQTCKVIVLDQTIKSMTEFKQIIGRGTRIQEDYGKLFFTILDFRKATELFADPAFDGDPVQIFQPGPDESPVPRETGDPEIPSPDETAGERPELILDGVGEGNGGKRIKYVVGDVSVYVVAERVQYYDKNGKLITESLREYARSAVREEFSTLRDFLRTWSEADRKQAIVDELADRGVFFEELAKVVGKDISPFDIVCHVAFDQPPLTRRERAANVRKKNYFARYSEVARAVLEALLQKYADEGVDDIEDIQVLKVQPLTRFGTPVEIIQQFGGKEQYLRAVRELEGHLYGTAA
jgi:type I restriction enzyme R subunit